METPQPLLAVLTLTALIDGLLAAVAARFGIFPIRRGVYLFLWRRLTRIKQRFATLGARFAAGKDLRPRPSRSRSGRAPRGARARTDFRLTRWVNPRFGWLCRVVPGPLGAPGFACQLRDLLADPELRALLAATPATARLLRPLCWMLGVPEPPPAMVSHAAAGSPPPAAPRADDTSGIVPIALIARTTAIRPTAKPPDPPRAFFKAA